MNLIISWRAFLCPYCDIIIDIYLKNKYQQLLKHYKFVIPNTALNLLESEIN